MKKNGTRRLICLFILSLFIFLPALPCWAGKGMRKSQVLGTQDTLKNNLVITGTVIKKEEVWDRRSNPLMGRPDILMEIVFHIQLLSVISGDAPAGAAIITASVKGQKMLIQFKGIPEGKSGIFTLQGNEMPFELIHVDTLPGKTTVAVIIKDSVVTKTKTFEKEKKQDDNSLDEWEKKSGKEMNGSKVLQEKAVRDVARKYGMKNAKFISLTSFSGPRPPKGGYIFWGVCGQIKGKWYVWQPGKNGKLREGKELDNPHKHQK